MVSQAQVCSEEQHRRLDSAGRKRLWYGTVTLRQISILMSQEHKMRTNFLRRLIVLALALTLMGGAGMSASARQLPTETVRVQVRGDYAYVYHTYTYSDGRTVTIVEIIPIRSIPRLAGSSNP